MKLKADPNAKLRSRNALSSTIGSFAVAHAPEEDDGTDHRQNGERRDGLIVEPIVARAFFQHVLERTEHQRHAGETDEVETVEKRIVGLVEVDEEIDGDRDEDSGPDVDQEQPVP